MSILVWQSQGSRKRRCIAESSTFVDYLMYTRAKASPPYKGRLTARDTFLVTANIEDNKLLPRHYALRFPR